VLEKGQCEQGNIYYYGDYKNIYYSYIPIEDTDRDKETEQMYMFIISMFHRAFFNSIIDKTPTHALFIQHYVTLAC